MNSKTYIEKAIRTESDKYQQHLISHRVEHAVLGLVTESAELADVIKKARFYGKKPDRVNMMEEMGDVMWYLAILSDELNIPFSDVWERNIAKLKARYPEKYSSERALKRNLNNERKAFAKDKPFKF